jgi:hypothetical protein
MLHPLEIQNGHIRQQGHPHEILPRHIFYFPSLPQYSSDLVPFDGQTFGIYTLPEESYTVAGASGTTIISN